MNIIVEFKERKKREKGGGGAKGKQKRRRQSGKRGGEGRFFDITHTHTHTLIYRDQGNIYLRFPKDEEGEGTRRRKTKRRGRQATYLELGQEGIQIVVPALGLWKRREREGWKEMSASLNKGRRKRRKGRREVELCVRTAAVPPVGFLGPILLLSTLYVEMI